MQRNHLTHGETQVFARTQRVYFSLALSGAVSFAALGSCCSHGQRDSITALWSPAQLKIVVAPGDTVIREVILKVSDSLAAGLVELSGATHLLTVVPMEVNQLPANQPAQGYPGTQLFDRPHPDGGGLGGATGVDLSASRLSSSTAPRGGCPRSPRILD